jgi:hypothetical protein
MKQVLLKLVDLNTLLKIPESRSQNVLQVHARELFITENQALQDTGNPHGTHPRVEDLHRGFELYSHGMKSGFFPARAALPRGIHKEVIEYVFARFGTMDDEKSSPAQTRKGRLCDEGCKRSGEYGIKGVPAPHEDFAGSLRGERVAGRYGSPHRKKSFRTRFII